MSIVRGKPWRFEAIGEGLADFLNTPDLYGTTDKSVVRPRIRKIRITSATGGNINLVSSPVDPQVLYNATLPTSADVTLDFGSEGIRVKGFYIEDIPADGLVEVWFD